MSTRIVTRRVPSVLIPFLLMLMLPPHAAGKVAGTVYYHTDHLGSTVAVSGNDASVVARLAWDPYGTSRVTSDAPAAAGSARFTGKQWANATGLTYFGARYHDPVLGRFLGPDAARQTSSPYAYVGAAPLERVDLDGNAYTEEQIENLIRGAAGQHNIELAYPSDWYKVSKLLLAFEHDHLKRVHDDVLRAQARSIDEEASIQYSIQHGYQLLYDELERTLQDEFATDLSDRFLGGMRSSIPAMDIRPPREWDDLLQELGQAQSTAPWDVVESQDGRKYVIPRPWEEHTLLVRQKKRQALLRAREKIGNVIRTSQAEVARLEPHLSDAERKQRARLAALHGKHHELAYKTYRDMSRRAMDEHNATMDRIVALYRYKARFEGFDLHWRR